MSKIQNFIGGKFQESPPNSYIPSENPATKQVLYQIPNSTENEANLAITAADAAFKTWSKTKYPTRAKYLQKIADMLQENLEYFAKIESQDMGKTLKFATSCDISGCIGILNRFIRRLHTSKSEIFSRNDVNPDDESETSECLHYTYKTPLGPCTIITPWNYPLYTVINKLAPCVAYGNTCVIKPSEYTSGTSFEFCKKLLGINQAWNQEHDAKLNVDGVINFVFGLGPYVGSKLCSDFRIKAVGFTGSTATAQKVNIAAAGTLKKVGLECGGKNPALVFADANLDQAVVTLKEACFGNNGQICVNTERVYVEESIFDQFLEKIVKLGEDLVVNQFGDPMEESTFIGPLVGKFHYEKVSGMVDRAIDDDSVTCNFGYRSPNNSPEVNQKLEKLLQQGYYFPPTILTNFKNQDLEIIKNEIFGPVCLLMPFKTETQAIDLANNTIYGLSSVIFTDNLHRAHRISRQIDSGVVWVNTFEMGNEKTPFGGMKMSGVDRETDEDHERFFTGLRNVTILVRDEN